MTVIEELAALKQRQRTTWAAGDYPTVAQFIAEVGEVCVERAGIAFGMDVLDVACGAGNATIPAARPGARVTGLDITPELLEVARQRADAAGVEIALVEGDAEALPFDDASFDRVLSTFGVMFAPRHEVAAAELARVCRPGGRIVLCNWAADGIIGHVFELMGRYMPPPPDFVSPPSLWGDGQHLRRLFARATNTVPSLESMVVRIPFKPVEYVQYFEERFGPSIKAREVLEPQGRWRELRDEWIALAAAFYRDGAIEQEYVVVTIPR
jgi:ubiquinone/menaquinone biosynthesis C-methylase UbiE